jgi:hypothetical protein
MRDNDKKTVYRQYTVYRLYSNLFGDTAPIVCGDGVVQVDSVSQ